MAKKKTAKTQDGQKEQTEAKAPEPCRIDRQALLSALESVLPCVAQREEHTQSKCLGFHSGRVIAYDGHKSCRGPSGLPEDFCGAVPAQKLADLLRRQDDEQVVVHVVAGEFRVRSVPVTAAERRKGESRESWSSGFGMEEEVLCPALHPSWDPPGLDSEDWLALPDDFCEALSRVGEAAGKDDSRFALTCVHLTQDHAEASDEFQMCRWAWQAPMLLAAPLLLRKESVAAMADLGVSHYARNSDPDCPLAHFKSPRGFILTCRLYGDEYPSAVADYHFGLPTAVLELPRNLPDAARCAAIFTADVVLGDHVEVRLEGGVLEVCGADPTAWYRKDTPTGWEGGDCCFLMSPAILERIARAFQTAEIGSDPDDGRPRCLRVESGPYRYATALLPPDGVTAGGTPDEEEDGDDEGAE
jgi:hypothetical protein